MQTTQLSTLPTDRVDPPMQIERKEITLSCMRDNETVPVTIMARVCGGLVIHKSIASRGFTLTHLASSVSLVTDIRARVFEQELILKEMAPLMDWSMPFDTIASQWLHDHALFTKIRILFARLRVRATHE